MQECESVINLVYSILFKNIFCGYISSSHSLFFIFSWRSTRLGALVYSVSALIYSDTKWVSVSRPSLSQLNLRSFVFKEVPFYDFWAMRLRSSIFSSRVNYHPLPLHPISWSFLRLGRLKNKDILWEKYYM